MNKTLSVMVILVMALCAQGCTWIKPSIKSVNIQCSGIRGIGDTALVTAIDSLGDDTEALAVKTKVKEITLSVQLFLQNGKVAELTIPEITQELEKLIPANYRFLVDIALAQIQGIVLDVDKIGATNLARINSLCVGIIRGCDLYDMKYRPVKDKARGMRVLAEVKQNPEPEVRFGNAFKKEMGVK